MVFSSDAAPPLRTGPRDPELRKARVCYDHLAGEMGVRLFDRMQHDDWLAGDLTVSERGWTKLQEIGVTQGSLPPSNRPLCRACLDWSERRHHLAGRVGRAMLDRFIALSWMKRLPASRVIAVSPEGSAGSRHGCADQVPTAGLARAIHVWPHQASMPCP
jgi:hypothetical protein